MIFSISRKKKDTEKTTRERERKRRKGADDEAVKRAAAAIKDRKSLLAVGFSKRTSHHNLDLEAAIIKATSHDSSSVDYSNAHRVYKWIRSSPHLNLKTLIHTLSSRVSHTRSWIVSLKSLMLLHGVISCKLPPSSESSAVSLSTSQISPTGIRASAKHGVQHLRPCLLRLPPKLRFILIRSVPPPPRE
ncbi:hypothetical protein Bca52824_015124 [Brassica carinata]|uniref:ENTH domain-containing protein n=1 Tax=Brassica carinata TaxID=52824 RepID=A0A8X7W2N8_BRACI|nr:hypothetical protein Bca52824_015124 [Brassica carinata]